MNSAGMCEVLGSQLRAPRNWLLHAGFFCLSWRSRQYVLMFHPPSGCR